MVCACITIDQSTDYKSTWVGRKLANFGTDLARDPIAIAKSKPAAPPAPTA